MAAKTKPTYQGTPEVTPHSVTKRGTKPQGGQVRVTHKRESRAFSGLRTYSGAVLFIDAMVGLSLIFTMGLPDPWEAHLMWMFGLTHVVAMVPLFIPKRE